MKSVLYGVAVLGVGGAAYAGMDSPDFDRTIKRPPAAVYAAFSALGPEGTYTQPRGDAIDRRVSIRTEKTRGEAIHYEILFDERPVVTAELTFTPENDGRATRLTAELDIDAFELGSAYETEAGVALALVPESFIDGRFRALMDDMADDIEAGRPLPPLRMRDSGVRRANAAEMSVAQRRRAAEAQQRRAAAPMVRPEPMVDPDAVARAHMRGAP